MRRSVIYLLLTVFLLTFSLVEAQQPTNLHRIGYLLGASSSFYTARIDAFQQGLNELGYTEGKNIVIEYRYADGKADRLLGLAAELVGFKVDVIIAAATPSVTGRQKGVRNDPDRFRFDY